MPTIQLEKRAFKNMLTDKTIHPRKRIRKKYVKKYIIKMLEQIVLSEKEEQRET